MNSLHGVWTALITPFTDKFEIDWDQFEKLLQLQARAKVAGVVITGSTGEGSTLSNQEKISLYRRARASLPKSVGVLAGTGGSNTQQAIELSKLAADAGVDGLLIVTPPYNKPTPAGLQAHFSAIADATSLPICAYHVPGRTGQRLSLQQLKSLMNHPKIVALKESSGDITLFSGCVNEISDKSILCGDDSLFLPCLAVGATGLVSVASNVFPEAMVQLYDLAIAGKFATARRLHHTLFPFLEVLFVESSPGPLKEAMYACGLSSRTLRLPLVPPMPENAKLISDCVTTTKKLLANFRDG
jgi:4-hydroxy-tetrahydrodipicolinate synthase